MTTQIEKTLMQVIAERDKLKSELEAYTRHKIMYDAWGKIPERLTRFIDRLVAERNEFEYYATMYKSMTENLLKNKIQKIEERMKELHKNSSEYRAYMEVLKELRAMNVTVYRAPDDAICESCQ